MILAPARHVERLADAVALPLRHSPTPGDRDKGRARRAGVLHRGVVPSRPDRGYHDRPVVLVSDSIQVCQIIEGDRGVRYGRPKRQMERSDRSSNRSPAVPDVMATRLGCKRQRRSSHIEGTTSAMHEGIVGHCPLRYARCGRINLKVDLHRV